MSEEVIIQPQPGKQMLAARCGADVMFYGGAAFSGKTHLTLLDSLSQVADPAYTGIIFRRVSTSIVTPGGMWDTSQGIFRGKNVRGVPNKSALTWTFPSGAVIKFSHLENESDIYKHHGGQYAYEDFDELTEFTRKQFFYLMTRNRGKDGFKGKCFVRAQCNPDADSWVREIIDWWIGTDGYPIEDRCGVVRWFTLVDDEWRWVDKDWTTTLPNGTVIKARSFTFIGATISDNQLGCKANPKYESNLYAQDEVTRERLLKGNWNITFSSGMINPAWLKEITHEQLPAGMRVCRYYDMAATQSEEKEHGEPASTAGGKVGAYNGDFYIVDMVDWMDTPGVIKDNMQLTAASDGQDVFISWEEEKGSSGKYVSDDLHKKVFAGYECHPDPVSGDKITRAKVWAALAEHGHVYIVKGQWNRKFKAQCGAFPKKGHKKDEVDAVSGAVKMLTTLNKVWPKYTSKNKSKLELDWSKLPENDVQVYIYIFGGANQGLYGNCYIWGKKSKKLWVYAEIIHHSPVIDTVAEDIKKKVEVGFLKKTGFVTVSKVFGSDDLFGKGESVSMLLMQRGIWVQRNFNYNEYSSVLIAHQMFSSEQIIVSSVLPETDRQYSEWAIEHDQPVKGYPLCRALCGLISDLKESGELEEKKEPKSYSAEKVKIRDKLRNAPNTIMNKQKTGYEYLGR